MDLDRLGERLIGHGRGRGARPVVDVSFDDAQEYVARLSAETGRAYRLPTEAEWEYAAGAGTTSRYLPGDGDPSGFCAYANHADRASGRERANTACDDGFLATAPVSSLLPNGFGLYDIAGNVWEWVEDCWWEADRESIDAYAWDTSYHPDHPSDGRPFIGSEAQRGSRVMRGGSWRNGESRFCHLISETGTIAISGIRIPASAWCAT